MGGIARAPYLKPEWFLRSVMNPIVMRLGLATRLSVQGRKSGRWYDVPVNVLDLDGERYLVAPRGETEWVRNMRVAGGGRLSRGSTKESFTAVELPDAEKQPVIDAYLARWGRQVKAQFAALPDTSDHPVFRIERRPAA